MDKKIKSLIIVLFFVFICTGCANANVTRAIRHSGFSLSNAEFVCPTLYPESSGTGSFDKIRFFTSTYAITTDGTIYSLSIGQLYSNGTNCKKLDFSPRVLAVFDDKIIKADDKKIYNLASTNPDGSFVEITSKDSSYFIYQSLMSDDNVLKVYTVNQDKGYYYVLMRDGNVYNFTVSKAGNDIVAVTSTSIAYSKSNFGGEIIDFSYAGDSPATFVRTNDAFFRMMVQNKEECTAYADVSCQYKMAIDEGLTKYKDQILAFSGSFLVTAYGKEFTVSGV